MITSGLLLVSGLVNAVLIIRRYDFEGGLYHGLVAVKLLLALALFWISSALAGRSSLAEKLREKMTFWLNVNVVLAVLLVSPGRLHAGPTAHGEAHRSRHLPRRIARLRTDRQLTEARHRVKHG